MSCVIHERLFSYKVYEIFLQGLFCGSSAAEIGTDIHFDHSRRHWYKGITEANREQYQQVVGCGDIYRDAP